MNSSALPRVVGKDNLQGRLETEAELTDALRSMALIRLDDGRQMYVPQESLTPQHDGSFLLALSLQELERAYGNGITMNENLTVPVVAEELQVGVRTVETGRVLFHKTVQEQEETVDPPLLRQNVTVERVAINRLVEGPAPTVRQEGDVMILPVLEEVLVVEKRLLLKEEVHIRQEQSTFHAPQQVTVRREEIRVERVETPTVSEETLTQFCFTLLSSGKLAHKEPGLHSQTTKENNHADSYWRVRQCAASRKSGKRFGQGGNCPG